MCPKAGGVQAVVIGANGLVGASVARSLTDKGIRWVGTYNRRPKEGLLKLDITSAGDVKLFLSKYSPQVVFHCANLAGGVDFCEHNPKLAVAFHLDATRQVAGCSSSAGAVFVFLSTDYVFDGGKGPYKEDDKPNPLNLYGKLKLDAENWIRDDLSKFLIVRTTNVYGWDPDTVTPNYMMSLYRTLKEKKNFNAPSFLWGK